MYGERPTASPDAPDMKDAAKAAPTSGKPRNPDGVRIGGVFGLPRGLDVIAFLASGACFGLFLGVGDILLLSHALATVISLP
jgi:hypothetical protein